MRKTPDGSLYIKSREGDIKKVSRQNGHHERNFRNGRIMAARIWPRGGIVGYFLIDVRNILCVYFYFINLIAGVGRRF